MSPPVETLPVQFISEKDFTQMTKGVKNAPQLKIPDLKPLADKVDAEKSVDQLAPKVADKPAITTDSAKSNPAAGYAQARHQSRRQVGPKARSEARREGRSQT